MEPAVSTASGYPDPVAAGTDPTGDYGGPRFVDDPTDHSVGDLLGRVTSDLSTLMRQEVELASARAWSATSCSCSSRSP